MAYRFTLADARKESVIKKAAASCSSSQDFVDQVNEAQRKLLRKGSWFSTETLVRICYYDNCLTWPRYVGTIEGMRYGNGTPIQVRNQWYTILSGIGQYGQMGSWGGSWGGAGFGNSDGAWAGGGSYPNYSAIQNSTLQYTDYSPFYRKIYGCTGAYLRVLGLKREDWGKKVTFFGTDWQGQPLQHRDSDGIWQSGIVVTLGNTLSEGFVQTSIKVRHVESVTKDLTQGNVMVYQWDAGEVTYPLTVTNTISVNDSYLWDGTKYVSAGNNTITKVGNIWVFLEDADPAYESLTDDIFGNWKLSPGTVTAAPFPIIYPTSPSSGQMIDVAVYEPSETNPRYRQSVLSGFGTKCKSPVTDQNPNGQCHGCVEALVKLAFIPLVGENDFIMIDCLDAIGKQIQAIRYGEAGDVERERAFEAEAVNILNAEMRTQFPDNETTVSIQVTPSAIRSLF